VSSLILLAIASFFFPGMGWALIAELVLYFAALAFAGLQAALRQRTSYLLLGLPLAIAVMHIAWGSGFLWSILPSSFGKNG